MSELTSVWQGTMTLLGVEMRFHVLSDGQRVIEADSVEAFIAALEASADPPGAIAELTAFMEGHGTPVAVVDPPAE